MSPSLLVVLYEDDGLLAVNKPAGLVCHPTKGDETSSLIGRARLHTGSAGVALVNRLDRETSGIVALAKTREAARELGRRFEAREARKGYLAIARGWPPEDCFVVDAPIVDRAGGPVVIQGRVQEGGAPSRTEFFVESRFEREGARYSVLSVRPVTGRKHQIRIHLEHAGHPIVGDKIYGGDPEAYLRFIRGELSGADEAALKLPFQALHAVELAFLWKGAELRLRAAPARWFAEFAGLKEWEEGGDAAASARES